MKDGKKRRKKKDECENRHRETTPRDIIERAVNPHKALSLSSPASSAATQLRLSRSAPPVFTHFKKPNQKKFDDPKPQVAVVRKNTPEEERVIKTLSARYEYRGKTKLGGRLYYYFHPVLSHTIDVHTILWHGTDVRNMADITKEGLQPGRRLCLFGSAIYLGKLEKAVGYCWGGALLRVSAKLGRVYDAPEPIKICPDGYDTVHGKAGFTRTDLSGGWRRRLWGKSDGPTYLHLDEWAVYDAKRVTVLDMYLPVPL